MSARFKFLGVELFCLGFSLFPLEVDRIDEADERQASEQRIKRTKSVPELTVRTRSRFPVAWKDSSVTHQSHDQGRMTIKMATAMTVKSEWRLTKLKSTREV